MDLKIKITKAGKDLDVVWEDLPDNVKVFIVEQGLGKLLNGATAKVTKTSVPDDNSRAEQAYGLAQKKLDSLKAGKVTARASKSDGKVPAIVMTEARRLAKTVVKAQIKAKGKKISDFTAKAITEAANLYLTAHPEMIEQAKASIAAAEQLATAAEVNVEAIPVDAAKVAKREAANAAKRKETEAKNAGKPGPQKSAVAQRGPGKGPQKPVPAKPAPVTQPVA